MRKVTLCALALLASVMSTSLFAADIQTVKTVRGDVTHQEKGTGESSLRFELGGRMVNLPKSWRSTNIEQVFDLQSETALLISHSTPACASQVSLAVIGEKAVWGPYQIGGCEEILLHQRADDGKTMVSVAANASGNTAWTYSSEESRFRGPAKVELPEEMQAMLDTPVKRKPQAPASAPATAPQNRPVTVKPPVETKLPPAPVNQRAPILSAPKPREENRVPDVDAMAPNEEVIRGQGKAAVIPQPTRINPKQAAAISQTVKSSTPARAPIKIDL